MDEQPVDDTNDHSTIEFGRQTQPDHSGSRRNQPGRPGSNIALVRLVFLVGLLLMVVWAMRVSGRAETWQWMFREPVPEQDARQSGNPSDDSLPVIQIDNSPPAAKKDAQADEEPGVPPDNPSAIAAEPPAAGPGILSVREYADSFLQGFLKSLSGAEQADFFSIVQHVGQHRNLPAGETAVAASLIRKFALQWRSRQAQWNQQVAQPDFEVQESVLQGVAEINRSWNESVVPMLESALDQQPADTENPVFDEFQNLLLGAADALVVQRSPVGRSMESYAWVAAWSDVFDQPLSMDPENLPRPTITQLLGQPEFWMGKTVAIGGTALRVERVPAGKGLAGMGDYHVIWIRPDHVASFPYCLYTLVPPESLSLAAGENRRELEIPVTAAARFFKVRMFDAGNQAGQAPLLMAATVDLVPEPAAAVSDAPFSIPGVTTTAGIILLVAALAGWLAWLAWRTSLGGKRRGQPSQKLMTVAMQELQDDPNVETIHEKLDRLGSEHEPQG